MPTPVNWYDDKRTIIKVTITLSSTWEEYHHAVAWIATEVAKVDHNVTLIFHDNVGMPKGNPIPHLKKGSETFLNLPNVRNVIIAGSQGIGNAFTRVILTTATRMALATLQVKMDGRQLLFMASLEDAIAYLKQNLTGPDQPVVVKASLDLD